MEGEDSVKTVDCLRGRLLAERLASRSAKEEEEKLGNKMMELENLLKQEAKSRNSAERKLKSLFKKLESMNISYVSEEYYSGLEDKTDISSSSSSSSSSTTTSSGTQESSMVEIFLFSQGDGNSENSSDLGSGQNYNIDSKMDKQSDGICYHSFRFPTEDGLTTEEDPDDTCRMDSSMALVVIDMPHTNQTVDPEVLDSTVKEVLDSLKHAKEKLHSSIERRRTNMIRNKLMLGTLSV
ncbi:hypothetical protein OROGR_018722 [Orobanche gracilis]